VRHHLVADDGLGARIGGPPAAPTGLGASPSTTTVGLHWTASPEPNVVSYNVYQLISATWTLIQTVAVPTVSYTVTGLTPNTSYSFRVTAVNNASQESAPSLVTVTTNASGGTDVPSVTHVIFGNKAAFVTWQKPSSGATVSSYIVSCTGQPDITMAPKSTTWQKAVVRNLAMGSSYTVTIKAVVGGVTNAAAPITGTVVWQRPELLTPAGDCITGVAAHGLTLTTYTGSLDLNAGTYDGFLFPGPVTAVQPGVVITRSKIVTGLVGTNGNGANGFWCNRGNPANGGTLEDVEIDCSDPFDTIAAGAETGIYTWGGSTSSTHPLICRRVNIHGCKSVNLTAGFTTMEYVYCWDIRNTPGNHADAFQIYNGSNYSFVGCEADFDVTKGETNGLVNSCFFVQSSQGPVSNGTADGCLFFGGESTIALNPAGGGPMTNVSLINVMIRRNPLPNGQPNPLGGYGPNGEVAGGNAPLYLSGFTWAANGGQHFNNHYEDDVNAPIPGS